MKKKTIAAAIALALLLCCMIPTTAFAETIVSDIIVKNVVLPVPGESPDAAWEFVDPEALTMVTPPVWCGKGYAPLSPEDTFEAGQEYYFRFIANVRPGYQFDPMNLYMNGSLEDAYGNPLKLESIKIENDENGKLVTFGVICQPLIEVDMVTVKGVAFPAAGEHPDAAGTLADEGLYFVAPPVWCGKGYAPLTAEDTFEEGQEYYYRFTVNVKPGYQFITNNLYMYGELLDAFGNDIKLESIKVENNENGKLVTLAVKCAALTEVDMITVQEVVFPAAGEHPDTGATLAGDALFFVTPPVWCGRGYAPLSAEDTFEDGEEYYFRFTAGVKPGYRFLANNLYIDGSLEDALGNSLKLESVKIENAENGKLVTLAVKCAELIDVDMITVKGVEFPAAGEHPDAAGTLAGDALFFVSPPVWCGKGYAPLTAEDTFEAGEEYYYRFTAGVKPGYRFLTNNLYINGSLEDAFGNGLKLESVKIENDSVGKLVTFAVKCALLNEVDMVTVKGAVAPAAGEHPDAAGALEGDALFFVTPPVWCGKGYAPLTAEDTFEAGEEYYYRFTVNVKPGCRFITNNLYMNGSLEDAGGNAIKLESIKIENNENGKLVTFGVKCGNAPAGFLLGDVDLDGEVTSGDARLALRASVKLEDYAPGSQQFLAADVDKNGAIESSDARTILRVSVKLESFD